MVEKTFNLTWNNHLANLSGLFEGLYKNGLLTDTTLACQDGTLKAHRLVLAACSPYFERVFKEHYGDQPILILKGVAIGEMECLLHFMYRGSIDVTEENLPSLIKIATELEVRGLSADYQNEMSNPYSHVERDNSKTNQQPNFLDESITTAVYSKTEDVNSTRHIKMEEIEVEDDPMIIDTHEDNFEDPLPLADKHIRNFPSSSYKRETRFKGKKRVSVGRITRSSDFMNVKYKSPSAESISSSRNMKSDSRISNNGSDPTVPEIQMNHESLLREDNIDLLPSLDEDVKAVRKTFDALKREEVCKNPGNAVRIDKKQYKPYSCDLCTLAFTRASHLARHRRVHTGERPFACTLCPRMFARQDKLKQHLDSHLQWPRKRAVTNEPAPKVVPVKGKRGRPRKVTVEQSTFEEILKFGEFSSMLNKSQSIDIKNDDASEKTSENTETSA